MSNIDDNVLIKEIKSKVPEVYAFPASYPQRQLWFLSNAYPDSSAYNIPFAFEIEGDFNYNFFVKAINKIIERHESFRTSFIMNDESLNQLVTSFVNLEVPLIDLSHLSDNERDNRKDDLLIKECNRTYDLTKAPLFNASVIKLSKNHFIILLSFHHIIVDHSSILKFTDELNEIYTSLIKNREPELKEVSIQYADFVLFQISEEQSNNIKSRLKFWKDSLKGELSVLDLEISKPRFQNQTFQGTEHKINIPLDTSIKIRELIKAERKSYFVVLLSAFNILMSKYSNQLDIIVGCPFSNRIHPGSEDIIGCVMNTLPIRTIINNDETFSELLQKVKDTTLNAQENQEVSFEQIVEEVQPVRDSRYNPLFQISFMYQEPPMGLTLDSIKGTSLNLHNNCSKFDLTLWMWDSEEGFKGLLEYNSDLYTKKAIKRLDDSFVSLLKDIVDNPTKKIFELEVIPEVEKRKLLESINNTKVIYPKNNSIYSLFEKCADQNKNSIAVTFKGEDYTYSQLKEMSEKISSGLLSKGLKENELIGIMVNRSEKMLASMLGVLRSGSAYLPLDPGFPEDRIEYMLEDAGIKYLIVDDNFTFSKRINVEQVRVTDLLNCTETYVNKFDYKPENLAYVIYTSGSTGKPKGVKIPQRAVVNFLNSMSKAPGIKATDKLLAVTTLSFDIAELELLLPILNGASAVIVTKETTLDGNELKRIILNDSITIMQATPVTWRLLLEAGWNNETKIKMLCGGEALSKDLAEKLSTFGGELWNMYGPTETTIWSLVKKIEPNSEKILIGKPIDNTSVYILNDYKKLVPQGVKGELYIGGEGLSLGYFNKDELTSERFIKVYFNDVEEVLYKTGDLAVINDNGEVECLGRTDFQVKIRGFRIEPEEIENQINKIEGINNSAVIAKEDGTGFKYLAAFIVNDAEKLIDISQIKNFLFSELPEYMVPNTYTFIKSLPLTPNNKIDRKALQSYQDELQVETKEIKNASTMIEYRLKKIFEDVLQKKNIGVKDNFFDIGGHSLLAAKLFAKIYEEMDIKLPLAILFQAPTIEELALELDKHDNSFSFSSLVPIRIGGSKPPLFLVHGAEGNVLLYRNLAKYLDIDQPVYGLQSQGLDGLADFNPNFEVVASHYIEEIKKLQPVGPYLLGGYCLGGTLAMEMSNQLMAAGDSVLLLAMLEAYNIQSNIKALKFPYNYIHKVQNVYYHLKNLNSLEKNDRKVFLTQKLETSKFRWKVRFKNLLGKIKNDEQLLNKYPHLKVQKINDEAQSKYIPRKYKGDIVLFRPKSEFVGLSDKHYGWRNIVDANIELFELPVNPHGMLVEPYVKQVASRLTEAINKVVVDDSSIKQQ